MEFVPPRLGSALGFLRLQVPGVDLSVAPIISTGLNRSGNRRYAKTPVTLLPVGNGACSRVSETISRWALTTCGGNPSS